MSTRQGTTMAASVNALPRSSLCSRNRISVKEELPEERHGGQPHLRRSVRLEHRHEPGSPERVEEVGHLPPIAGAVVVGLRCREGVQPAMQRLQLARKPWYPRSVG